MTYFLAQVAEPAHDSVAPSWVATQEHELGRTVALEIVGHEDFVESLHSRLVGFSNQIQSKTVWLVAVDGIDPAGLPTGALGYPIVSLDAAEAGPEGRVLASLGVNLPLTDNEHLAYVGLDVAPAARHEGIGSALSAAAEDIARRHGRTTLQNWLTSRIPADAAEALVPANGISSVARDANSEFLLHRGWRLEQVERQSELELPSDGRRLEPLWDAARAAAADYAVESWDGPTPAELIPGICRLLTHFSTEHPTAGLDTREEVWTPERYAAQDERRLRAGTRPIATLARHRTSGEVVALTEFALPQTRPRVVFQNITIVDAGHRGHRLGMLTKIANLRALEAADPGRRVIYTWNAHENAHMLAINDAMGFVETRAEGAWQKVLSGGSGAPDREHITI